MSARSQAASRYTQGGLEAPVRHGDATLMPTRIRSGLGASVHTGRVHLIASAVTIADARGAVLAARWLCGGAASNVIPADDYDLACDKCKYLEALGAPLASPAVYRCYDSDGALLYIGSSIKPAQRVLGHRSSTHWWPEVATVTFEEHITEGAARLAEAQAILAEDPIYNRFHSRSYIEQGARR